MLARAPSHAAVIGPGCVGLAGGNPSLAAREAERQTVMAPSSGAEAFCVDPAALAAGHKKHTT